MDPTKNKPVLVQISKSILEGFNEYPDILNHEFVKDQINLVEAAVHEYISVLFEKTC